LKEKVELCKGDFVLAAETQLGFTVLYPVAPFPGSEFEQHLWQPIYQTGKFSAWDGNQWRRFLLLAERFYKFYPELKRELEELRRKVLEGNSEPEYEVCVDGDKISITGKTYQIRSELKSLGFLWDPASRAWVSNLTDGLLQEVEAMLKKHGKVTVKSNGEATMLCPVCGSRTQTTILINRKFAECPNCGLIEEVP